MTHLYYNIGLKITIADSLQFTVCHSIKIESSVQVLAKTAKIELPRAFKNAVDPAGKGIEITGKSILDFIKRGDAIKIELGYDGNLETEFEGYITKIGAETPLILECEDDMFHLKKSPRITKFIKSGKLKDILKATMPASYTVETHADYSIGNWLIENNTPYEVLKELRDKIGVRAYFKNPTTLSVGMVVDFKTDNTHQFNFSTNIRRGSSLKFERKEDFPVEITVVSEQSNGKKLTYSTGVKGGNTISKSMPDLTHQEMVEWADQSLKSNYFTGFRGSFESWCYPRTKPGDLVELKRPMYKDEHQDGTYFIESVTVEVNNTNGIKRTNNITYKI